MNSPVSALVIEHSIASDLCEARRVQCDIELALQQAAFAEHDIFAIKLAVEEALVNAIKHGNRMDRSKQVRIHYHIEPDRFEIGP